MKNQSDNKWSKMKKQRESVIPDFQKDDEVEQMKKLLESKVWRYTESVSGYEWTVEENQLGNSSFQTTVSYDGVPVLVGYHDGSTPMNKVEILDKNQLATALVALLVDLAQETDVIDKEKEEKKDFTAFERMVRKGLNNLLSSGSFVFEAGNQNYPLSNVYVATKVKTSKLASKLAYFLSACPSYDEYHASGHPLIVFDESALKDILQEFQVGDENEDGVEFTKELQDYVKELLSLAQQSDSGLIVIYGQAIYSLVKKQESALASHLFSFLIAQENFDEFNVSQLSLYVLSEAELEDILQEFQVGDENEDGVEFTKELQDYVKELLSLAQQSDSGIVAIG